MDEGLFAPTRQYRTPGRVRKGVDADIRESREAGNAPSAAGIAALRVLADRIDQLERTLRSPAAKAYDHVPLVGMLREFRETYETVFTGIGEGDPFARALSDFLTADAAARGGAPVGDPPGPDTPQ